MKAAEFRAILSESNKSGQSIAKIIKMRNTQSKPRKKPSQPEHELQCKCVDWFRDTFPHYQLDLFAIGNGGKRDAVTGAFMKREGVTAGVADLCLAIPRGNYGCLFIEMKTKTGKQSPNQIAFQRSTTKAGNKYVVCRTLEDFKYLIISYLRNGGKSGEDKG